MMFKKDLLEKVLSGIKTQTRRLHKNVLKVGRIYSVKRNWFNCTGDYIRIVRVYRQKLGDVSEEEAVKEGFSGLDEFRDV